MNKPTLVIMAAGMGSRFGGCKQITPVDENGHVIMDYSIFDALQAAVLDYTDFQNETFAEIHPGGAVGKRLNNVQ